MIGDLYVEGLNGTFDLVNTKTIISDSTIDVDRIQDKSGRDIYEVIQEEIWKTVPEIVREGFQKTESKIPLVYDLEKRIKEINGEVEISMGQLERLVDWAGGLFEAEEVLSHMYPSGYRLVIYEEEKPKERKTKSLRLEEGTLYMWAYNDQGWVPVGQNCSIKDISGELENDKRVRRVDRDKIEKQLIDDMKLWK